MNFYETQMGRRFFEGQLPRLIQALERISELLEEKSSKESASMILPVSVPEDYLNELYYGNIKMGVQDDTGYSDEKMQKIVEFQNQVEQQFTKEQWELFQEYNTLSEEYTAEEACRMFQNGFRLAVHLIAAGFGTPKAEKGE